MQTALIPQRRHNDQPQPLHERARLIVKQIDLLADESYRRGHKSVHVLDGCAAASESMLQIANTLRKAGV